MSEAIAERAAAIRQHLRNHDPSLVRKYSFVAARYEQMKLAQIDGDITPADDQTFRELTQMLQALTRKLGLGDTVTGWKEFLPKDPQRLIYDSWIESARISFS